MSASAAIRPSTPRPTHGIFNYLAESIRPSLRRTGRVLTRRDADGSDSGTEGVVIRKVDLAVRDARALPAAERPLLARNGFELRASPLPAPAPDFLRHEEVVRHYYEDCARIVREATGAAVVRAFDHNVRSASGTRSGQRIEGGQQVQPPAHVVHGDYTLTSAPERLRQLARPPGRNDTLRACLDEGETLLQPQEVERALAAGGRFAIVNVWRNIAPEPVATRPIAFCDARSVHPEDLVVFEIHYADRIGENYFARHSPRHRWHYYPAVERDEVLLIQQWDSAGPLARSEGREADAGDPEAPCTFSFHSAFRDPRSSPDAPDRRSIEVRCVLLYEPEAS